MVASTQNTAVWQGIALCRLVCLWRDRKSQEAKREGSREAPNTACRSTSKSTKKKLREHLELSSQKGT